MSELSTSYFSSLDLYFDYVEINISLKNSSLFSFLNIKLPQFAFFRQMAESTPFLPLLFPPPEVSSFRGIQLRSSPLGLKRYFEPRGEGVFDWVISSHLLLLNDPDIPTLLHRSSASRSFPDISFAPFFFALSCFWEVLQNLGFDHLPILLSLSGLSSQQASPFFNF